MSIVQPTKLIPRSSKGVFQIVLCLPVSEPLNIPIEILTMKVKTKERLEQINDLLNNIEKDIKEND